jgi:hypothetical protein
MLPVKVLRLVPADAASGATCAAEDKQRQMRNKTVSRFKSFPYFLNKSATRGKEMTFAKRHRAQDVLREAFSDESGAEEQAEERGLTAEHYRPH